MTQAYFDQFHRQEGVGRKLREDRVVGQLFVTFSHGDKDSIRQEYSLYHHTDGDGLDYISGIIDFYNENDEIHETFDFVCRPSLGEFSRTIHSVADIDEIPEGLEKLLKEKFNFPEEIKASYDTKETVHPTLRMSEKLKDQADKRAKEQGYSTANGKPNFSEYIRELIRKDV